MGFLGLALLWWLQVLDLTVGAQEPWGKVFRPYMWAYHSMLSYRHSGSVTLQVAANAPEKVHAARTV